MWLVNVQKNITLQHLGGKSIPKTSTLFPLLRMLNHITKPIFTIPKSQIIYLQSTQHKAHMQTKLLFYRYAIPEDFI
jgi:hypothetical protein